MKMKIITVLLVIIAGCSGNEEDPEKGEHVWKEQTATIQKADQVEDIILDAANSQRQAIDEQGK